MDKNGWIKIHFYHKLDIIYCMSPFINLFLSEPFWPGYFVRKLFKAIPGLKGSLTIEFFFDTKMCLTAYVLSSLRFFKPKTKEQTM